MSHELQFVHFGNLDSVKCNIIIFYLYFVLHSILEELQLHNELQVQTFFAIVGAEEVFQLLEQVFLKVFQRLIFLFTLLQVATIDIWFGGSFVFSFIFGNIKLLLGKSACISVEQGEEHIACSEVFVVFVLLSATIVCRIDIFPLEQPDTSSSFLIYLI